MVVILGQFEQPDIGREGRPPCNLAGCSEDTGGFRGALLTTTSALSRLRPTWHCYFCYPRARRSALSIKYDGRNAASTRSFRRPRVQQERACRMRRNCECKDGRDF